jgi:phage-related protein
MSALDERRRRKTFAPRLAPPAPARPHRARPPALSRSRPVLDPNPRPSGPGQPMPEAVRRRLEEALDRPLSHVRLHAEPADRLRAAEMGARAFAHRHHIWLGPHESASDLSLLSHEVTHVTQQGFAPRPAAVVRIPAPLPARAAHGPRGTPHRSAASTRPAAPAVQRMDWDLLGRARRTAGAVASGVRAVGGAIAEVGSDLLELGRDALLSVVRRVAPDFLPLFEGDGIGGFIRKLVEGGLRSMFDGVLAPIRDLFDWSGIRDRIGDAKSWMGAISEQLARNDCSGVLAAARRVGQFFGDLLDPVVSRIRGVAETVRGFFSGLWDALGAPLMDMLKRIGGKIWDSLKSFVRDVGKVIRRVRDALGVAWRRVRDWFGIGAESGEEEGGGLWEWIKGKARSIGDRLSNLVRPVLGPLKTVGGVLLMLVPGGQLFAVMKLWPRLKKAWGWLSQKWSDLNLIPRARQFLAETVLPALMDAAEAVGQAFVDATDWLLGLLERVSEALESALSAATGMLAPLARLIGFVNERFQRLLRWARGGLQSASRNMRSLIHRLLRFLGLVLDMLGQLILLAINPFGIPGFLAGTIWRLIPECLKGPIIDFVVDLLIRLVRVIPSLPGFGLVWELVRSVMLGYLEQVQSFSTERKVAVSNKLARIVSGMSPGFTLGFLKGMALGVWEGIIAPFQAIAAIFDLPEMIKGFVSRLGIRMCELIESIRCFAVNAFSRVIGTLDDVLRALGEILQDPGKILDLIRCAIEGALAAAHRIGASIADQMMALFESAEEAIGEQLGRLVGNALLQAVITYFTAGAGAAIGVVQKITSVLGSVGRALGAAMRLLTQLFGRLVAFLRGLAARLGRAVASGARSVLGRLGGFFRRVAAWFRKLVGRMTRGLRRRLALSPQERTVWLEFRVRLKSALAAHPAGIARGELRRLYRGILASHRLAAKWPAFITKHGPEWRLWVRRVKSLRPRKVGTVLLDPSTRLRAALKEVKRTMKRLKRRPGILGLREVQSALPHIRHPYRLKSLTAEFDEIAGKFDFRGAANPVGSWRMHPERPPKNEHKILVPQRAVTVDPLVRAGPYDPPVEFPAWNEISKIKAPPSGTSSLYVRGHLAHGRFAPGSMGNLAPITRRANARMRNEVEGDVIRKLRGKKKPVFKYEVMTEAPRPRALRLRRIGKKSVTVPEEKRLVKSIKVRFTEYGFDGQAWKKARTTETKDIENVPGYPAGYGEARKASGKSG